MLFSIKLEGVVLLLDGEDLRRYRRQIILSEIGEAGQERLKQAKVLVIGTGGLGSPCILYLAAAGVGTLGIMDSDQVDLSNLNRQILHRTGDLGRRKVDSAADTLAALNPGVAVRAHDYRLTADNVDRVIADYEVILSCVDNFATRYLLNDACVRARKPLVEAGVAGFAGVLLTVVPGRGPCYRCLFPESGTNRPTGEIGIVGAVAGIVGAMQAVETVKLLLDIGRTFTGRLLAIDTLSGSFSEVVVKADPLCPACGQEARVE